MKRRLTLVSFSLLVAFALVARGAQARAAEPEPPSSSARLGFLLRMNMDFGGSKLVDVTWSDGSTGTLRAGQLITFSGGVLYHAEKPWAIEAMLGYKFDKVNGSNGTIEFTRIPVDVVASWAPGNHRLGAGPTFHLAPRFRCDAASVCSDSISFNTAVGAILQYAYVLRPGSSVGFELGVRGTLIRYASSDVLTQNGSGVGFFFGGGWI